MSSLNSILKVVQGWVKIKGGSDGTFIGNTGDRLKISGEGSEAAPGCPVLTKKLRYEFNDIQLALTTAYQSAYTYSGSGKFIGITLDASKNDITVKVTIDTTDVLFEIASQDLNDVTSSGNVRGVGLGGLGWDSTNSILTFEPVCDVEYLSEVKVEVKKTGGPGVTLSRTLVSLTKET